MAHLKKKVAEKIAFVHNISLFSRRKSSEIQLGHRPLVDKIVIL